MKAIYNIHLPNKNLEELRKEKKNIFNNLLEKKYFLSLKAIIS